MAAPRSRCARARLNKPSSGIPDLYIYASHLHSPESRSDIARNKTKARGKNKTSDRKACVRVAGQRLAAGAEVDAPGEWRRRRRGRPHVRISQRFKPSNLPRVSVAKGWASVCSHRESESPQAHPDKRPRCPSPHHQRCPKAGSSIIQYTQESQKRKKKSGREKERSRASLRENRQYNYCCLSLLLLLLSS